MISPAACETMDNEAARVLVTPRPLLTHNLTDQEGLMTKPTLDVCESNDCTKRPVARGFCNAHWKKFRASSDYQPVARVTACRVDGCGNARCGASTLCSKHAARYRRHGDVEHVTPVTKGDPLERFWSKVDKGNSASCWIYRGTILGTGYGQFTSGRAFRVSAHRFAYETAVGPIPDGLTIDHLCSERTCVNPAHLEPVTNAENVRRRHARDKGDFK